MIELSCLKKSFDEISLFSIDHIQFPDNGIIVIKGENGCGKTTLLNILSFLDTDYEGTVLYDGKDIRSLNENERTKYRRDNIAYVFQKNNLISFCNIGTNLDAFRDDLVKDKRMPNTLSQGQQEIIAIKRALSHKKKIYLFDEVLSSLDTDNRKYLIDKFKELSKNSLVIVVSHDVDVDEIADYIYEFKEHTLSIIKESSVNPTVLVSEEEQVIHKRMIFKSYLLHSKALSFLNMILMCLMLCFGYVGCEASNPDVFFKAYSAIGNNPYILLSGKSDMTSEEIIQCFPDNAYEAIYSDFPLVKSKDVPNDDKVYCNQKTYNYWLNEWHHRIKDNTLTLNASEKYEIGIDDTIKNDVFLLNSSSDSGLVLYSPENVSWNSFSFEGSFVSSLSFYNESAFKKFYKLDALPFELEDDIFYVFNEELVSDHITEYTTPTFIDRNSYEPDFNELFGTRMRAKYVSVNDNVSPYDVLMSDNTAKILKDEYKKHEKVLVCSNGTKFKLSRFVSFHRYTIQSVIDKSVDEMSKYNNLILAITNSTTTFTYGIFVYFILVIIPLAEIALFFYTYFLNRNNIRSLYSLGMSKWSLYFMLILPFLISFMLGTIFGGILSLVAVSFQFLSFGFGILYTLALQAMIFVGTYLIWARRKQR